MSRKSALSDWNEYDRHKRDMLFIAQRLRKRGKNDNYIVEFFCKSHPEPLLKGLVIELEWYLNHSRKQDLIIIPLYEGASWIEGKGFGNTPDFIVAGEYPEINKKGIFFVEVKSSRKSMENDRRKIKRMQRRISRISEVSGYKIPLFVFFKENAKWRFRIFQTKTMPINDAE